MSLVPPPPPHPTGTMGLLPPPPPPLLPGALAILPPPPLPVTVIPPLPQQQQRPNQLLFTNVPAGLHQVRTLRDWILSSSSMSGSGSSIRSVLLLPPPSKIATTTTTTAATDGRERNSTTTSSSNSAGASNSTSNNNNNNNHSSHETSSLDWKHRSSPITALVTVSHFDVAIRIVSAFRYMVTTYRSGSNNNNDDNNDETFSLSSWQHFHVHLVPHHPDIALPPLVSVDPIVATTGEAMYRALLAIICHSSRDGATETDMTTTTTTMTTTVDHTNNNTTTTPATDDPEPDTGDPLLLLLSEESPAVWEAVRKFREHLATLQGDKATKRHEKVSEALAAALPRVRQQLRAAVVVPPPLVLPLPSSSWPTTTTTSSTVPPPPPPPSYGVPPQPRGVSNQPAWMTQQQQQQQSNVVAPTPEEPPTKRSKVDVTDPTLVFPLVPPDQIPALRQYTSQQIQQYLGEAEETLVTFCLNQMTSTMTTRNVATLLPELTEVLDDDAVAFVQSIYEYSQRLVTNSGMG